MEPVILEHSNNEFIPLSSVINKFGDFVDLVYKTKFSVLPFFRKMEERANHSDCEVTASLLPQIVEIENKMEANSGVLDGEDLENFNLIVNSFIPSIFFDGEYSFLTVPFSKQYVYSSPSFKDLEDADKFMVKFNLAKINGLPISPNQHAVAYILKEVYKYDVGELMREVVTFKDMKSGVERHYKLNIKYDYIDLKINGTPPKLTKEDINDLLNNFMDAEVIKKYLPPSIFSFSGFAVGIFSDVTGMEIQSQLKGLISKTSVINPQEFMMFLKKSINNFLNRTRLDVGLIDLKFSSRYNVESLSLSNEIKVRHHFNGDHLHRDRLSPYQYVYISKKPFIVHELNKTNTKTSLEEQLIRHGYQSVILYPITDIDDSISFILEIGSNKSFDFSEVDVMMLEPIISLVSMGNEMYQRELEHKINQFIQTQFTSIHPSVEWKFMDIATEHEVLKERNQGEIDIEPIVFKDIYPIYGQADIVNSSNIRNEAIRLDLIDNLERLVELLGSIVPMVNFQLLDVYLERCKSKLKDLVDSYSSSKESLIINFLMQEVHPFLEQIVHEFEEDHEVHELIDKYFSGLDERLGIVYLHRQSYEQSVTKLNKTIANYLTKADEKLQETLPHYFEKYKTDGVEYNMYLGQSISNKHKFTNFHLKNFRLWQLQNFCEITRIVDKLKDELPIELVTAQLIFVYSQALSIRFRMDEKQFDVDGTYNVRYEILKKRIDKAYVKGTDERLTQAGKIAIVYLLESDKQEYLEYLEYLIAKGFIKEEIEDLELEKMQGADGLKALRVEVVIPS